MSILHPIVPRREEYNTVATAFGTVPGRGRRNTHMNTWLTCQAIATRRSGRHFSAVRESLLRIVVFSARRCLSCGACSAV